MGKGVGCCYNFQEKFMRSFLNWIFRSFCRLVELTPEQQQKLAEERGRREILNVMAELKRRGLEFPNLVDIQGELKSRGQYTKMTILVERCDQIVTMGLLSLWNIWRQIKNSTPVFFSYSLVFFFIFHMRILLLLWTK